MTRAGLGQTPRAWRPLDDPSMACRGCARIPWHTGCAGFVPGIFSLVDLAAPDCVWKARALLVPGCVWNHLVSSRFCHWSRSAVTVAAALPELCALPQDPSDLLEGCASSGDLQNVSDPADGANGMDRVQDSLRATAETQRAVAAGREGSERRTLAHLPEELSGMGTAKTVHAVEEVGVPNQMPSRALRVRARCASLRSTESRGMEMVWQILDQAPAKYVGEEFDEAHENWDSARRRHVQSVSNWIVDLRRGKFDLHAVISDRIKVHLACISTSEGALTSLVQVWSQFDGGPDGNGTANNVPEAERNGTSSTSTLSTSRQRHPQ